LISQPPLSYQIADVTSEADTMLNESGDKGVPSLAEHAKNMYWNGGVFSLLHNIVIKWS
jgi:hypothetical protein